MKKLYVLIFTTLCKLGLGGREKIMIDINREFWITNDNFIKILAYSLPFSHCVNTHSDDLSIGVESLFNQFEINYRFPKVNNHQSYHCLGYFGIGGDPEEMMKVVEQRVPTSISTTELLLIVDNELPENSSLLNATNFHYANVNIVSRSGIWTLSENYLFPRSFKKINDLRELEHKQGIVNFHGRKLQVAAFHDPPLCYLSTTINKTVKGIEAEFFVAEDIQELDGIEMKLFLIMAEKLNFTWSIRKPSGYYRYGTRDKNGVKKSGGIIGQLARNEIDLAFSGIWLKLDHYLAVNESKPWYQLSIHFLVPRPKPITSIWALTTPFLKEVWLAIAIVVILQSINLHLRARMLPYVPARFKSFISTLTELLGRLLGSYAPRESTGLRVQLQSWHIFGILLATAYCSSLASRLATPQYEPRIDRIEHFSRSNLTWGGEGPSPIFEEYFDMNNPFARRLQDKYHNEASRDVRLERIQQGNYAIIGRIVEDIFFPEYDIGDYDLKDYRLMKEETTRYYVSFATQPWLLASVDEMMMWMQEGGLTTYFLKDVIYRRTSSALRNVLIEHDLRNDSEAKILSLEPLFVAFSILFSGLLLSSIVFYYEWKSKNCDNQSSDYKKNKGKSEKNRKKSPYI